MADQIFDVWWDGPYDADALDGVHDNCVLYMICGTHGLYGRNVPLYLGMTLRNLSKRISEHHE